MDENTIYIISFTGEIEKKRIWLGGFMAISGIKAYYVLLTGAKTILSIGADEK